METAIVIIVFAIFGAGCWAGFIYTREQEKNAERKDKREQILI